jgi:hypothetical protein
VLEKKVREYLPKILHGNVLALDPSSGGSSDPGWALFVAGELQQSGTVPLDKKDKVEVRLRKLHTHLQQQSFLLMNPDIVCIEKIRGSRAHAYLQWSIGSLLSATRGALVEMPIPVWKGYAKQCDGYAKGDEADAIIIGMSLVQVAREVET